MFPERQVTIIVPFGRDGASDRLARVVGARLAERWGVEVSFDNRPGDGAVAGTAAGARAAPDGHTLVFGSSSTHSIAPALRSLPYDPVADFAPLALFGWAPNLMLVRPGLAKSVTEVLALARKSPGALRYASAGTGQTIHLCGALFAARAGIDLTHVPFDSGSMDGLNALMAGEVDLMFDNVLAALPYIRDKRVAALAVAGSLRFGELPGVPTLEEAGVPGCAADIWLGLFAPAATPAAALQALRNDLAVVLGHTDLIADLRARGLMLDVQQGEDFAAEIAANALAWRDIVAACGLAAARD